LPLGDRFSFPARADRQRNLRLFPSAGTSQVTGDAAN